MTNFMSLLTCFAEKTREDEAVYRFEAAVEPSDRVDFLDDSMLGHSGVSICKRFFDETINIRQ